MDEEYIKRVLSHVEERMNKRQGKKATLSLSIVGELKAAFLGICKEIKADHNEIAAKLIDDFIESTRSTKKA